MLMYAMKKISEVYYCWRQWDVLQRQLCGMARIFTEQTKTVSVSI